jgi:hypothetical protein
LGQFFPQLVFHLLHVVLGVDHFILQFLYSFVCVLQLLLILSNKVYLRSQSILQLLDPLLLDLLVFSELLIRGLVDRDLVLQVLYHLHLLFDSLRLLVRLRHHLNLMIVLG